MVWCVCLSLKYKIIHGLFDCEMLGGGDGEVLPKIAVNRTEVFASLPSFVINISTSTLSFPCNWKTKR